MKFHIEISEYCKQDVILSAKWYSLQQIGLGERFVTEFENTVALIAQNPEIGNTATADARRFPMRTFPYILYYQILTDLIRIIACLHGARQPGGIEDELKKRN